MPHLLSSWPLCEPLSPSVPGSYLCSQLRRKGENPEQGREAPFPSPPSGWPCAPATPLTRSQRSLPTSGCARCAEGTSGHRWPLALPERLLLRALWAPGPGRQHSNSAGSRHSCQNQGGCLGKPRTEPADFGRQPGCASGQEEEQLGWELPLAGLQPPRTASPEAQETYGCPPFRALSLKILASSWGKPQVHSNPRLVFPSLALCGRSQGLSSPEIPSDSSWDSVGCSRLSSLSSYSSGPFVLTASVTCGTESEILSPAHMLLPIYSPHLNAFPSSFSLPGLLFQEAFPDCAAPDGLGPHLRASTALSFHIIIRWH